jgi:TusA-related sulfurtransferase
MMTTEELKNVEVAKSVDARGTACPGPLLAAKKAIGELEAGEIMEILSADEGTKNDIPRWCEKVGHKYLGFYDEDSFSRLFLIKE